MKKLQPPHLINRNYHCRQRNRSFNELLKKCRSIRNNINKEPKQKETVQNKSQLAFLRELQEIELLTQNTLQQSELALFGRQKNELKPFSIDPKQGYLDEELLLLSILREKKLSIRFLKQYLQTEIELREYQTKLQLQQAPTRGDGNIDQIAAHVKELQQVMQSEMEALVTMQGKRSELAKVLFDRLQELQPVRPQ